MLSVGTTLKKWKSMPASRIILLDLEESSGSRVIDRIVLPSDGITSARRKNMPARRVSEGGFFSTALSQLYDFSARREQAAELCFATGRHGRLSFEPLSSRRFFNFRLICGFWLKNRGGN